ncbi:MAG: helix-hairpin-helix domain-containing protein [Thermoguttaceae bacterium]
MSQAHAAAAIHKAACQAILAAFQEYAPETTLRSAARDDKVDLIKVAIDELSAHVDVLTIDRIRLRLGVTTLLVVIWSDDPKVRVARALQPAVVERVLLYEMLGRAIAIVQENQIHLAKGDDDRNVRLASKLCGWDIEVMTAERLDADIDRALIGFRQLDGVTDALAHRLVEQGFLTYDDLSIADPDALREMGSLSEADANAIITQAESMAEDTHRLDL